MLFHSSSDSDLFIVYEKNETGYLLAIELSPLSENWEKEISVKSDDPVISFFDDYVACNCEQDKVCLLSRKNGETIVSLDSNVIFEKNYTGFLYSDELIFYLCNANKICAYDIDKKKIFWEHELSEGASVKGEFKLESGKFFFIDNQNRITVLNRETGKILWKSDNLPELKNTFIFPETVVAEYEKITGFSSSNGENKWLSNFQGTVRCIMDGFTIVQSDDFFRTLFVENGLENWNYPRTGTTFLTCQDSLSLAAFTVKNLGKSSESNSQVSEYFDKVYIFDVTTGERIFDYNSSDELKVLNITGFMSDKFYIAFEKRDKSDENEITVKKFSTENYEESVNYVFYNDFANKEIYVSLLYSNVNYTVFRITDISSIDSADYLFSSENGKFFGRMESFPEVISGDNVYDIISYDEYFNVIKKKLTDFLLND